MRGGKATTASKQTRQLGLFSETAESPKGDDDEADEGLPMPAPCAVPKSENTKGPVTSAMTMEAVPASSGPQPSSRWT